MDETFDPYHHWLGIPPREQPPNHYRLLGVAIFESDSDVISNAADERMAHLRTFQTGPHAALSQKLLNEVAAARVCLLQSPKKTEYDEQLRQQLPVQRAATPPPVRAAVAAHSAEPNPTQLTRTWDGLAQWGDYQVLEKLGEGGMGAVYKAIHTKLKRVVALKVLPSDRVRDPRARARFDREMQAAGAVDHPNVVRGTDAREVEGTVFLVMEYVDGLDLGQIVRRGHPLAVADACELARQAALGLQAAHEHNLVHRDVKPSNLMLSRQGHVKLLDLGLARFEMDHAAEEEVTGTGVAIGTLDYIAPEQLVDSRSVDIRADIYSLGCTLFKLLAGQAPFAQEEGPAAQMNAHLKKPPPRLRRFRDDVPPPLTVLIDRMLAKDPAKRYPTPGEVADALVPHCLGADLMALLARVEGHPAPAPVSNPAQHDTHDLSSGLTHFLQGVIGRAAGPASLHPHGRENASKKLPRWAIPCGVVTLTALVLVAVGLLTSRPDQASSEAPPLPGAENAASTRHPGTPAAVETAGQPVLMIQWPAGERADARLEIDGKLRDPAALADPHDGDVLKLPVVPGWHRVWIARRGFQPFEQVVTVAPGKDMVVQPAWSALRETPPEVASMPPPEQLPPVEDAAPIASPAASDEPANLAAFIDQQPGVEPAAAESGLAPEAVPEKPVEPAAPTVDPVEQARRDAETRFAAATAPVEKLAAEWQFDSAVESLARITFSDPSFQARRNARGRELQCLAAFKKKLIDRIDAAEPRLAKSSLMLKGVPGQVTGAGSEGITAQLADGTTELHPWANLSAAAVQKVVQLAVDPEDADGWVAAGLLSMCRGDASQAERALGKARSLGANIDPYLGTLAQAALARVDALLAEGLLSKADDALTDLEKKYGATPWFADNRAAIESARATIRDGEAEKLYAEAAALYQQNELFDVRPLVQQLKEKYGRARLVSDTAREPSVAAMEDAVSKLGRLLVVRLDGKGDFTRIGDAVTAAQRGDVIQIQDSGPYSESVIIPKEKPGITLRGKRGTWPVILSTEAHPVTGPLVGVYGPSARVERLVLANGGLDIQSAIHCVVRHVLVIGGANCSTMPDGLIQQCVFLGDASCSSVPLMEDTLVLNCVNWTSLTAGHCVFLRGTLSYDLTFDSCVLGDFSLGQDNRYRMVRCLISGEISGQFVREDCIDGDPLFRDPVNLDYRAQSGSPCLGKASDGGDIGLRYTPEIIAMCKVALELRARRLARW